jgi:hypothetical protein
MEARLVIEGGTARKRTVRLRSEETIIGRRQDCDLRIKSAAVSRRHCLLSIHDGYLSVEDLDSVNGTFLNGKRVLGKQTVRPGDLLEIGPARFVVEYDITQDTLDRINQGGEGEEEHLEVLPLAEGEAGAAPFAFGAEDQNVDVLPYEDQETANLPPPAAPGANDDEPLPVLEELEDGGDWHLPESGDLRDILSDMDDPKTKRPGSR